MSVPSQDGYPWQVVVASPSPYLSVVVSHHQVPQEVIGAALAGRVRKPSKGRIPVAVGAQAASNRVDAATDRDRVSRLLQGHEIHDQLAFPLLFPGEGGTRGATVATGKMLVRAYACNVAYDHWYTAGYQTAHAVITVNVGCALEGLRGVETK